MITDMYSNVVQQVHYAPFGEVISEYNAYWHQGKTPDYMFNAKELDEENSMYYYEERYYNPPLFISRDPHFESYPTFSPYTYCFNNPVNVIDPTGKDGYITGNAEGANTAFNHLQERTTMKLERNNETGQITTTSKPITDVDKKLHEVLTNSQISATVEVSTDPNVGIGEYWGTEYNSSNATAASTNKVNITKATQEENGHHVPNGVVLLHELVEGYEAGKIAIDQKSSISKAAYEVTEFQIGNTIHSGKSPLNPKDYKLYEQAHLRSTPEPRYWKQYERQQQRKTKK
jgi:RHS repeat-associated protein